MTYIVVKAQTTIYCGLTSDDYHIAGLRLKLNRLINIQIIYFYR